MRRSLFREDRLSTNAIVTAIRLKVREQIEKTEHLIRLLPPGSTQWAPNLPSQSLDTGHLLGHLLECLAGFCAVFVAAFPSQLSGLLQLKSLPVNHACMPEEALARIQVYARSIENGFDLCSDAELGRMLPTVFAPAESLATLLLGNLEHLINHKYQLFLYLKLLGAPVGTGDLYSWRGDAASASGG
jgi:hypothetical protein